MTDAVYVKNNSSIFARSKITKTVFKNLQRTCSHSIFIFNGEVYQQIDGLSVGSPLAPLLANWFASELKTGLFHSERKI